MPLSSLFCIFPQEISEWRSIVWSALAGLLLVMFVEVMKKPSLRVDLSKQKFEFDDGHNYKLRIKSRRDAMGIFKKNPANQVVVKFKIRKKHDQDILFEFEGKADQNPEPLWNYERTVPDSKRAITLFAADQEEYPVLYFDVNRKVWLPFDPYVIWTSKKYNDDFFLVEGLYVIQVTVLSAQVVISQEFEVELLANGDLKLD